MERREPLKICLLLKRVCQRHETRIFTSQNEQELIGHIDSIAESCSVKYPNSGGNTYERSPIHLVLNRLSGAGLAVLLLVWLLVRAKNCGSLRLCLYPVAIISVPVYFQEDAEELRSTSRRQPNSDRGA